MFLRCLVHTRLICANPVKVERTAFEHIEPTEICLGAWWTTVTGWHKATAWTYASLNPRTREHAAHPRVHTVISEVMFTGLHNAQERSFNFTTISVFVVLVLSLGWSPTACNLVFSGGLCAHGSIYPANDVFQFCSFCSYQLIALVWLNTQIQSHF